jgi:hypothetical protein
MKKYGSIKNYNNQYLKINYPTLKNEFQYNSYHPFYRIIDITKNLNISKEELYKNIIGFYHWGSHRKNQIIIPKVTVVTPFFVEGYSLYLAEGDTGFNGNIRSRKLRFTNSNVDVINFFIHWINDFFPKNEFYVNLIIPKENVNPIVESEIDIERSKIRIREGKYNKIIKYRVCLDSAVIIDLFLAVEYTVKQICLNDRRLAASYVKGMMIGEGTVYLNRSRYVRIEMRNEKEIKYLHKLLIMLGFNCEPCLRKERENMWSLYIGARQLKRFNEMIGFGVHKTRQEILEKGIKKKLRVNQYK